MILIIGGSQERKHMQQDLQEAEGPLPIFEDRIRAVLEAEKIRKRFTADFCKPARGDHAWMRWAAALSYGVDRAGLPRGREPYRTKMLAAAAAEVYRVQCGIAAWIK